MMLRLFIGPYSLERSTLHAAIQTGMTILLRLSPFSRDWPFSGIASEAHEVYFVIWSAPALS